MLYDALTPNPTLNQPDSVIKMQNWYKYVFVDATVPFQLPYLHLADAFIQSDLQCIQATHFDQYVCSLGIEPTTFCAANAMLYHWVT